MGRIAVDRGGSLESGTHKTEVSRSPFDVLAVNGPLRTAAMESIAVIKMTVSGYGQTSSKHLGNIFLISVCG